jgi:hypothetical protein
VVVVVEQMSTRGGGGAGGFREDKSPLTPYTASPLEGAGSITVTATDFPITVGGGGALVAHLLQLVPLMELIQFFQQSHLLEEALVEIIQQGQVLMVDLVVEEQVIQEQVQEDQVILLQ